jgi:hypothetical protein
MTTSPLAPPTMDCRVRLLAMTREEGMTWAKELEELRAREALAEQMGGADKVARQHSRGKMDARARLAALMRRRLLPRNRQDRRFRQV